MRLIVQYAFMELNLRRVTLGVNAYNPRAIQAYEKVGFIREGVVRGDVKRENQRFDSLEMGLLYEDWLALQGGSA
jgi:RimJ/RimL family protein N-acetyltransferase